MSLPYFPSQSVAQLPSWVQFGSAYSGGSGSVSYKIDSQGGSNKSCMFYRFALPQTKDISIEAHVVFRNKLVASENGYEGLSVQLRGYRITGANLQVIWNNNVLTEGDQSKWAWENRGAETIRHTVVSQLPTGLSPDCIDVCVIVHAPGGGYVEIDNVELRNLYSRRYTSSLPASDSTGGLPLESTTVLLDQDDDLVRRTYYYYMQTQPILINTGENVTISADGVLSGSLFSFANDHSIEVVVLAKFRFRTGTYKTIKVMSVNNLSTALNYLVNILSQPQSGSITYTATDEINQVEYILALEDTGLASDPATAAAVAYSDLQIEIQTRGTSSSG